MIEFSKDAKEEILKILASAEIAPNIRVRLGIKGNACEGSIIFGLDTAGSGDEIMEVDQVPLVISKKHLMYVMGSKVNVELVGKVPTFKVSMP